MGGMMSNGLRTQLLLILEEHDRTGSPTFKDDSELADMLDVSKSEIERQLKILESRGLVLLSETMDSTSARITPEGSVAVENLRATESPAPLAPIGFRVRE